MDLSELLQWVAAAGPNPSPDDPLEIRLPVTETVASALAAMPAVPREDALHSGTISVLAGVPVRFDPNIPAGIFEVLHRDGTVTVHRTERLT